MIATVSPCQHLYVTPAGQAYAHGWQEPVQGCHFRCMEDKWMQEIEVAVTEQTKL